MEGTPLLEFAALFRTLSSFSRLANRAWAVPNLCIRLNQGKTDMRGDTISLLCSRAVTLDPR
jgi:hypothetical protein